MKRVIFIGCGDIATRSAALLQAQKHTVLGVRRNTSLLPQWLASQSADVQLPETLEFLRNTNADTLVYILAASSFNEQAYKQAYINGLKNVVDAARPGLAGSSIRSLLFVSSTAVYHQNGGELVNESTHTEPARFNGKVILQAEKLALSTGVATCVRFSGIYGPGRLRMIERVKNGQCTPDSNTSYTNRVHVEDCAKILMHLIQLEELPEIVLASDSEPANAADVESYIAATLGVEKRYRTQVSGSKRIAGSKRCSNQRLIELGYQFIHPDYRSGYRELINTLKA